MTIPRTDPRAPTGVPAPAPAPPTPPAKRRGLGTIAMLVLAPLLCCAGPLILGALAATGAATLGTLGGVIGGIALALGVGVWITRRRRGAAACCAPGPRAGRR
jgi:hypothetical protein